MNEMEKQPKWTRQMILRELYSWFLFVIIPFVITFSLLSIFKTVVVSGESMMNTYHDGDLLVINRLSYKLDKPNYRDVVVFEAEGYQNKILIKRVIAVEGDTIEIKNGNVYVNDEKLNEPYIDQLTEGNVEKITVPEGMMFVMGDNRGNSLDSRSEVIGFVPESSIIGKAVLRVYPFNQIGLAP